MERFPDLQVYVHARGAPHLVDPTRLLQSAERIYGDEMEPLWGRVVPVPERNLHVLEGGETIAVGGREFDVEYTPGHASHHVVYFDRTDGTAYVGDVAGVRIPPADYVRAPTPPPDIDVEAWQRSIDLVARGEPARLALTHFGDGGRSAAASRPDEAGPGRAGRSSCASCWSGTATRTRRSQPSWPRSSGARARRSATRSPRMFEVGSPVEQRWLGLRRYWQKQQERAPRPDDGHRDGRAAAGGRPGHRRRGARGA